MDEITRVVNEQWSSHGDLGWFGFSEWHEMRNSRSRENLFLVKNFRKSTFELRKKYFESNVLDLKQIIFWYFESIDFEIHIWEAVTRENQASNRN